MKGIGTSVTQKNVGEKKMQMIHYLGITDTMFAALVNANTSWQRHVTYLSLNFFYLPRPLLISLPFLLGCT